LRISFCLVQTQNPFLYFSNFKNLLCFFPKVFLALGRLK
jgi:hypothetical protein